MMPQILDRGQLAKFNARQREIIQAANDWGYFDSGLAREQNLYRGRNVLDIGMGGGPHSIAFIVGGAASYTGVDPVVGASVVADFRALTDPSIPNYHAFPYSVTEIMAAFPNITLHAGCVEEYADNLRSLGVDFIALSAVTEHLEHPDQVIKAAYEAAADGGLIWISHANYYSWTGHHFDPRSVEVWDQSNSAHHLNVDWAHLNASHHAYSMASLNRMRLGDFRQLVEKYFEIIQWREYVETVDRLTPAVRRRWKRFTLSELLARMVYVYGRKRKVPLPTDLSSLQFFHPTEEYRAEEDYTDESDSHIKTSNLVFFSRTRSIGSHSYNKGAGSALLGRMAPGDRVTLQKYGSKVTVTVEEVLGTADASYIRFVEDVSADLYDLDSTEWTIVDVVRQGRSVNL